MARYGLRRLLAAVPILLAVSIVCFLLMHAAPGGPVNALDLRARPEDRARVLRTLALDRPLPVQYVTWLGRTLRGDLGTSLVTGEPVGRMILQRLPATLELMGTALVFSLLAGTVLGVTSARHRGTALDAGLGALSLVGLSVPVFWLGALALAFFAGELRWLPPGGRATLGVPPSLADHVAHLVLPAAVLACVQAPLWSRQIRASLAEVEGEEWLRAARARGLGERRLLWRHALRPAFVPVVTLLGLQAPALFTGAVITETVFAWPGIGRLFYEGVTRFDYPRLMAILMLAAALVVLCNLVADLVSARLDPRIALGVRR